MAYLNELNRCLASIRAKTNFQPKIALVLGSGLGGFASHIKEEVSIPYSEIENFPVSTVVGHSGRFVFGYLNDVPMVIMQGRVHYYEGYPMAKVVLPIRLMGMLGANVLFLSNAAGGANKRYSPGSLMLITDHIASMVPSPLIGANIDELGTRFPDMSNIYNPILANTIKATAKNLSITLEQGVYMQFTGPQYESPAEVNMARFLGADAVGMSTACEAIAANHMGLKVCGISCITNMAAGMNNAPLDHKDVQLVADKAANHFQTLVKESILEIDKLI